jgi:hypothetical protein
MITRALLLMLPMLSILLLFACSDDQRQIVTHAVTIESASAETGSFRVRNPEIRAEMLAEFDKGNIDYWLNDDGSIGYNSVDGKDIDRVGNLIIGAYITRN